MKKAYDAIVVGGGIGGLTSAAYMTKYGLSTLLVEKEEKLGGLVNTFWKNGYAFDGGIRAFENSGILFPMLKNLGIEIEFIKSPVSMGFVNNWIKLKSRDSLEDYKDQLKENFPNNKIDIDIIGHEIKKVMGYLDVIYGIDNPLFLDNMREAEYFFKTLLPWLLKYQINIRKSNKLDKPINDYLRKFTSNQALIDMITQHFFKNTPTNFALSYFGLYLDYSYPKGGTGVLVEEMGKYIRSNGGKILTDSKVEKIDNIKKEIETNDGQIFSYKKLVWAADNKALYRSIKGETKEGFKSQKKIVESSRGSDSIFSLYMGVNMPKEKVSSTVGVHGFFTPSTKGLSSLGDWKEHIKNNQLEEWIDAYLQRTTYEISIPVMRDSSLAPEGKTGIIISSLMDYGLVKYIAGRGDYERFKEFATDKICKIMDETLLPGLLDNIEFTIAATPLTIEKITGNSHGAITGWEFTDKMPSTNKFNKIKESIKTPMNDIYQCGQWSFSPAGLPVSILTGKLAADQVKKSLKGKFYG